MNRIQSVGKHNSQLLKLWHLYGMKMEYFTLTILKTENRKLKQEIANRNKIK